MPSTPLRHTITVLTVILLSSCARMGQPDGGWYDQLPPRILGTTPKEAATLNTQKRITISFDEYVKLDNPQQNVIVSPPQKEEPTIKVQGKKVVVELKDQLLPNTTYTIDFADAIKDLNEGNPLGNYTYTFSTGETIDTLQVSGWVLDAFSLEPVSGITVGLCQNQTDSMIRVARTAADGHFVIKGVGQDTYHIMALNDVDGDLKYSQQAEQVAFRYDEFTPTVTLSNRQDTTWTDSLHIKAIARRQYNRFLPDDIVLRAFTANPTHRTLAKTERQENEKFTLYFTAPDTLKPHIRPLQYPEETLLIQPSEGNDTVTCWINDSTLIRQDTLHILLSYRQTDTLGVLQPTTDTLNIVARKPFLQKQKEIEKETAKWQQQQKRRSQRGEATEQLPPTAFIQPKYNTPSLLAPDEAPRITLPTPPQSIDTNAIHLYVRQDTLWHTVQYRLQDTGNFTYEVQAQWMPGYQYSFEVDSMAITDIYNRINKAYKAGIKVSEEDEFGTLDITVTPQQDCNFIVQLTTKDGTVVKQESTVGQTASFKYLRPATYYLRAFADRNGNRQWDTGDYLKQQQPEEVYYYPKPITTRAKWDIKETWNINATPLNRQKPREAQTTVKQNNKSTQQLNIQRAKKMGIKEIPEKVTQPPQP